MVAIRIDHRAPPLDEPSIGLAIRLVGWNLRKAMAMPGHMKPMGLF